MANSLCKLILQKYFLKWLKFLCFGGCEMGYLYLIAFAIIHGKRSSPTAKSISFGTKEFAIAGATIHFSIMLSDSSRVKQLFTIGTDKAKFVPTLAKCLFLLSKVDIFRASRTYAWHDF